MISPKSFSKTVETALKGGKCKAVIIGIRKLFFIVREGAPERFLPKDLVGFGEKCIFAADKYFIAHLADDLIQRF